MKLEEAYLIVEEICDKVKNQDDMSVRVNEAINALDKDIEKIRDIVENKRRFKLTWNDLSSKHFEELMCNFYELADGSSRLLNNRKKYDLGPIARVLVKSDSKVADDNEIKIAIKNIRIYKQVYDKIKELSNLIREYNEFGYSLKVPSQEFKIPLKEVYNDYRFNAQNNATN